MAPSTEPPMRGMTLLRRRVASFLEVTVPPLIDAAREQWPVEDPRLLPYPVKYDAYDMTLVEKFPAIGFTAINDRDHVRVDVNDCAEQEYWITYSMRMFILARSPEDEDGAFLGQPKDEAIRLRDDLLGIVKGALLQTPSLGDPANIRLDEGSITTDYLEPIMPNAQSRRWIAGSINAMEIKFREYTHLEPYGVVFRMNNTVEVM
jgi:hypothetical protein